MFRFWGEHPQVWPRLSNTIDLRLVRSDGFGVGVWGLWPRRDLVEVAEDRVDGLEVESLGLIL